LNATTFKGQCSHDAVVGTITNTTPIYKPKPREGRMGEGLKSLESLLVVGAKIKIGKLYSEQFEFLEAGQVIELVEGHFEHDNGLYVEDQTAPSWWDAENEDFDSIYHLFGNDLESFMDCEVIST
jgi:hypothetical protein